MDATPQRLTDFMTAYASALTSQIVTHFVPLYTPTTESRDALVIPGLKRSLFTAQHDTVAALVAAFRHHRTLGLAGEPGFGKTFTTLALARALGCRRVLVLCPPHLVEEWREEAERSLEQCPSYIMEHVADVEAAVAASRRTAATLHPLAQPRQTPLWLGASGAAASVESRRAARRPTALSCVWPGTAR